MLEDKFKKKTITLKLEQTVLKLKKSKRTKKVKMMKLFY